MVSHQLVYYGFRLSHQKRSPLQSHKDKAYGTLLPGICIRTAASLERIGVESVPAPGVFQTFFTLISHKIVSKIVKRFYRMFVHICSLALCHLTIGILWAVP